MILEQKAPKTGTELIRRLQRQRIVQIEVIEPYDPVDGDDLTKIAKEMSHRSGTVTVILLRST
jgi:TPP-dependent indolepyruvate ferredoxin oxidoreductase alpha subunit